jgi:hypothetical protein
MLKKVIEMARKPALKAELADASGKAQPATPEKKTQLSRKETFLIGIHRPYAVRRQLKALALELDKTSDALIAEALNMLFAKHGKPEIA